MGDALSTITEAIESVLASREVAEKVAAAREEQREICARVIEATRPELCAIDPVADSIRAAFIDATPLADIIAGLRADLEETKAEIACMKADEQMLSDDDDACHRLLDAALGEGSLATTSMETLLERLPRLIADRDAKEEARAQEAETQCRWMHRAQDAETARDEMTRVAKEATARVDEVLALIPRPDQVVILRADYERLIGSLPVVRPSLVRPEPK